MVLYYLFKKITKGIKDDASSGMSTMETSWGKAMKRPQSLSNVATALSQNGFPSLVTEGKPVNNLPAGSVWAKKSRSVMQVCSFKSSHTNLDRTTKPVACSLNIMLNDLNIKVTLFCNLVNYKATMLY